jgi:hypothetical protein
MVDHRRVGHALAGLVSQSAAALYTRLLAHGSLSLGAGAGEVDVQESAVTELWTSRWSIGVRYRYVYKTVVYGTRWGREIIHRSLEAG